MKYFLSIIFFLFCLSPVYSQQPIADHKKTVKEQAGKMGDLLLKKDYDSFARYNHPAVLKMMGGKQILIEVLQKSISETESEGISLTKVSVGEPTEVINQKNELLCTIPQIIELKVPDGRMVVKSTLVAISADNGKNWWFLDTANKDPDLVRKIFPNLSTKIVVPKNEEPVFYKD